MCSFSGWRSTGGVVQEWLKEICRPRDNVNRFVQVVQSHRKTTQGKTEDSQEGDLSHFQQANQASGMLVCCYLDVEEGVWPAFCGKHCRVC